MATNTATDPRNIEEHFEEFLRNVEHASGTISAEIRSEMRRVFFHGATATAILFAAAVVKPEAKSVADIAAIVDELHTFAGEDSGDALPIALDSPRLRQAAAAIRRQEEPKPARRQHTHALKLHHGGK